MTAAPKCTMEIELNMTLLFNGLKRKGKVQKREKKIPFYFCIFCIASFLSEETPAHARSYKWSGL